MDTQNQFPSFDIEFEELNRFILELVHKYNSKKINSWEDLDTIVKAFFTSERMDDVETRIPGWKQMASFSNGVTLTHVLCVFLGLFMLNEFQELSIEQRQLAKWIVLFHDVEKNLANGKRDSVHMVKSAVNAANALPSLGFPITRFYRSLIHPWSEWTDRAVTYADNLERLVPDNNKAEFPPAQLDQAAPVA